MSNKLEETAQKYELIAKELDEAAKHYRTASKHFKEKEVPRGSAHAYAGWGHMNKAETLLKAESVVHAENSAP